MRLSRQQLAFYDTFGFLEFRGPIDDGCLRHLEQRLQVAREQGLG